MCFVSLRGYIICLYKDFFDMTHLSGGLMLCCVAGQLGFDVDLYPLPYLICATRLWQDSVDARMSKCLLVTYVKNTTILFVGLNPSSQPPPPKPQLLMTSNTKGHSFGQGCGNITLNLSDLVQFH